MAAQAEEANAKVWPCRPTAGHRFQKGCCLLLLQEVPLGVSRRSQPKIVYVTAPLHRRLHTLTPAIGSKSI